MYIRFKALIFAIYVLTISKLSKGNRIFLYGNIVENRIFLDSKFRAETLIWFKKLADKKSVYRFQPPCYLDSDWCFEFMN